MASFVLGIVGLAAALTASQHPTVVSWVLEDFQLAISCVEAVPWAKVSGSRTV
jgi:hypothetical protein